MNINDIAVLGAGAIGASVIHQLRKYSSTSNFKGSISVIAEGERAERYKRDGLKVNGEILTPPIVSEGDFDLIILATKSYHLDAALSLMDSCIGEKTLLMSLLNGIASEGILGERYGHERVIPAMILGIDAQNNENGIHYTNDGVIHYGPNPVCENQKQAVEAIDRWFIDSGLAFIKSTDITKTLWQKFMINVGANQASAYYKAPFGELQRDTKARKLMLDAINEVIALSQLEKTGLTRADIDDWEKILQTLNPESKTSMAQDATAGRKTEVDLFAGTVVALAEKHGLEVPVNRMLLEKLGN